jgi:ribosomal protein S18 acetylase RimI-like enzyme
MEVSTRPANPHDVPELVRLYELLEEEMVALKPIWALADGLAQPVEAAWERTIEDLPTTILVGTIDGIPAGFLVARSEPLLPQAGGEEIGSIRLIFTEPQAREVGVGEAMIGAYLDAARSAGITRFDAHVPPGHRNAKNFFESNGFSARRIVMHHDEDRGGR